jgi:hypothetical protein
MKSWVARLTVAIAIGIAGACGGSKSTQNNVQPSDDGGASDAPVETAVMGDDDAGSDAEPPDNGPWPAAHFPMPQFINLGGKVLASPRIITVTFVGNANRDALRMFDDQILIDPWWGLVTQGYGIGAATGGVYIELPDTVSNTTLDDTNDIQPMIAGWVASGALPAPDSNSLYMIYFPSTTTITLQGETSCNYFGAYHNSGPVALEAGTLDTAYAIMPDCGDGLPEITLSASHELIEASTDPHPETGTAWYGYNDAWFAMQGQTGGQGEVADVCQSSRYVTDTAGNYLSRSWSNVAAMASQDPCQPETPGENFFAIAVPTQNEASKTVSGMTSGGYIPMKQGQTQTIDSVIFSDAQLPSDVQLTVGTKGHGTLGPLGGGITATLSPTAGHNGMHVALTIQVPMTTPSTDYPAIVRATLATAAMSADAAPTSTHHDWPIIIRVHEATD